MCFGEWLEMIYFTVKLGLVINWRLINWSFSLRELNENLKIWCSSGDFVLVLCSFTYRPTSEWGFNQCSFRSTRFGGSSCAKVAEMKLFIVNRVFIPIPPIRYVKFKLNLREVIYLKFGVLKLQKCDLSSVLTLFNLFSCTPSACDTLLTKQLRMAYSGAHLSSADGM